VWAIVVAAGEGRRFGRPKQFEMIAGKLVLEWAIDAARSVARASYSSFPKHELRTRPVTAARTTSLPVGPSAPQACEPDLVLCPSRST